MPVMAFYDDVASSCSKPNEFLECLQSTRIAILGSGE